MKLKEIQEQMQAKLKAVNEFWDGHPEDDLSKDDESTIKGLNKEIEELNQRLTDVKGVAELRDASRRIADDLNAPRREWSFGEAGGEKGGDPSPEFKQAREATASNGARFVESPEFKGWLKNVAPTGHVSDKDRIGNSPAVGFKTLLTGASATSAGAMVRRDYAGLVEFPFRPLTIRDVITIGQTGSDLIEYPRITGYTNNAAAVAEATNTSTGTKPESAMALEKVTTAVKTIAHWIPVSKRALADAPQIRTLIDNFLEVGLQLVLEDQIVAGDGTGENLTGILNTSGLGSQAFDTNLITTTRKARTKVKVTGRATATAYLMHPNDWEAFDLLADNEMRYYYGGPMALGNPRLWGLPVVESEAVPEGTAICGDMKQVVLWDREEANIRVSDQHASFFIQNLVAILAELRAALGVLRPLAIVQIDLTA